MANKAVALKAPKPEIQTENAPDTWTKAQPASLEMFEPRHVKGGKPELGDPKDKIEFQFNPKEVTAYLFKWTQQSEFPNCVAGHGFWGVLIEHYRIRARADQLAQRVRVGVDALLQ